MSNRYGKVHVSLPHCLRQLPENQPRNREEFMLRKRLNPGDPEMYFDNARRFLYENKSMAQELEELKNIRTRAFSILQRESKYLKAVITREAHKPQPNISAMRTRYKKAQAEYSKSLSK